MQTFMPVFASRSGPSIFVTIPQDLLFVKLTLKLAIISSIEQYFRRLQTISGLKTIKKLLCLSLFLSLFFNFILIGEYIGYYNIIFTESNVSTYL